MSDYQIEHTRKGATKPSVRRYAVLKECADAWDTTVENALGGEQCRLINNVTGTIMSEYNPIDRGE